jgi:phage shock protein C
MNERLYRTVEDRMLLGVMGGISLRLGMDPSIVRVIYAIVTVVSGIFPLVIAYAVMAFVIPDAPPGWEAFMRAAGRGGDAGTGARGPTAWGTPGPTGWDAGAAAGPAWGEAAAAAGAAAGPAWGEGLGAPASSGPATTDGRSRGDPRVGAIVGGLVLLGLGLLFLLVQLVPDLDWGLAGPVALVALGVILVIGSIRRA